MWGFVLLSWGEEGSTLLSKLCVWLRLPNQPPPPLCLLCSPGHSVCRAPPRVPMLLFPRNAGVCITCLPCPGLLSDLAVCAALLLLSLVLEGERDSTVTFDSRLSQLTDWHTT